MRKMIDLSSELVMATSSVLRSGDRELFTKTTHLTRFAWIIRNADLCVEFRSRSGGPRNIIKVPLKATRKKNKLLRRVYNENFITPCWCFAQPEINKWGESGVGKKTTRKKLRSSLQNDAFNLKKWMSRAN